MAKRFLAVTLACCLVGGCSGRTIPGTLDGSTPADGPAVGDGTTGFCTGTSSKATLNGAPLTVLKVTGEPGPPMSCCFAPAAKLAGPGFGKDRVTLCLSAGEGKVNSHLHSVKLYASNVEVTWK